MKTAIIMSSMPKIPLIVEVSWKTTIPIKTAVNGSIAPKIEVNVGPICLIALTKAILEIALPVKPGLEYKAIPFLGFLTGCLL